MTEPTQDQDLRGTTDPIFDRLIASEERKEQMVGRIALLSWAATVTCLMLGIGALLLLRDHDGAVGGASRYVFLATAGLGTLCLLSGTFTSLTWLLRSRTPSLRAIERRLAALERHLRTDPA